MQFAGWRATSAVLAALFCAGGGVARAQQPKQGDGVPPAAPAQQPQKAKEAATGAAPAEQPKKADEVPPTPFPLRLHGQTPLENRGIAPLWLPARCDAAGDVFVRFMDGGKPFPPVVKFSRSGEKLATFSVEAVGPYERETSLDFAVDPGGGFYFVAGRRVEGKYQHVILQFNDDGSLDSTILLDTLFSPLRMAAFKSGEFLVTGMTKSKTIKDIEHPFTAIVKSTGEVHEIKLNGDVSPPEPATGPASPTGAEGAPAPKDGLTAVQRSWQAADQFLMHDIGLGEAVGAEDGNVYLFRLTESPLVYVIQPNGEVLRKLELKVPWPGYGAVNFGVSGGRIILGTQTGAVEGPGQKPAGSRRLALYNAETGEFLYAYEIPEQAGALACFAPSGVTFLAADRVNQQEVLQFAPF